MYYLRTKPAANPIQFTVDKSKLRSRDSLSSSSSISNIGSPIQSSNKDSEDTEKLNQINQHASKNLEAILACARENKDACMACSS